MHTVIRFLTERHNLTLDVPTCDNWMWYSNGHTEFQLEVVNNELRIASGDWTTFRQDPWSSAISLSDPRFIEKTDAILRLPRKVLPDPLLGHKNCSCCWEPLETKTQEKAKEELTWLQTASPNEQS
jgi:hypothetical protein